MRTAQLSSTLTVATLWLLTATRTAGAEEGKKVLVLPYQSVFRSVPQAKLNSATELLSKELERKEGILVVRGAVATKAGPGPTLDAARESVAAAAKATNERRPKEAIEAWRNAITTYEADLAALVESGEYIEAQVRLAEALMRSGADKEAKVAIEAAARMAPGLELPALEFSRLFRRWFTEAAQIASKERPGQIMVLSALPGGKVSLDGRPMEVAPVLLEKVVPGKHLVRVEVPDVPAFATVATVGPGQNIEVRASFAGTLGGSAVGKVTDALAQNGIPRTAVESAAQAGRDVGAAFVVLGAMAKDEDRLNVHTFVVEVGGTKIEALGVARFDLEMLTAESDVLRIAEGAFASFATFPAAAKSEIAQVEGRMKSGQSTITKVSAAPELTSPGEKGSSSRKPKGPRAVFKPLKGGTMTIKDEEEN